MILMLLCAASNQGMFAIAGLDARSIALGNAGVVYPFGAVSAYYNPAGVAWMKGKEVLLFGNHAFGGIARTLWGVYAQEDQGYGAMAFSAYNLSTGAFDTTFTHSETFLSYSIAKKFSKVFSGGLTVKGYFLNQRYTYSGAPFENVSANGFGLDIGCVYRAMPGLFVGGSLRDIYSPIFFSIPDSANTHYSQVLPWKLMLGGAYIYPFPNHMRLSGMLHLETGMYTRYLGGGVEFSLPKNVLSLRLGFRKFLEEEGRAELRAGVGFVFSGKTYLLGFDYTYVFDANVLGACNVASFRVRF